MASRDSSIRALAKQLGKEYRVTVIDFEPVVYRDFGNGFNVEISGMYTTSKKKRATIYLWIGESSPDCYMVKAVGNIAREDIAAEVEALYEYSCSLVRAGLDNRDAIFRWKNGD